MKYLWFVVALAACSKGGKEDSGKVASCHVESVQSCREYRDGNLALGTESLQKLCTAVVSSAKFTLAPCPTANVIAVCAKSEGKDLYYTGYVETPAAIEATCKANGGTYTTK
ncbi:MAG: hypothetical protein M4D80_12980 [Myxococcota bacterium]|nr:hypothetical protein [Myxococcota bacterium]